MAQPEQDIHIPVWKKFVALVSLVFETPCSQLPSQTLDPGLLGTTPSSDVSIGPGEF